MKLHITVPVGNVGDVSSDLSGRRGQMVGMDSAGGGMTTVEATCPLAEVMTYARTLSSMTGGQGSYTMEFSPLRRRAGERPAADHRQGEAQGGGRVESASRSDVSPRSAQRAHNLRDRQTMSQLPAQADAAQPKLDESAATGIRASLAAVLVSVGLGAIEDHHRRPRPLVRAHRRRRRIDARRRERRWSWPAASRLPPSRRMKNTRSATAKSSPRRRSVIATGLLAAAVGIAIQSVREILTPHHAPAPFTLVVLVLVVVTKEMLFRFLFRTGESIDSKAMRTDAWHHRSDSLTSLAAFIGISIALWGGKGYEPADDWAALFAAGVIAFNGVRLFRTAWREIMDASLPEKRRRRHSRNRPPRRRRGRHRHVPRPQERPGTVGRYPRRSPRRHDGPRRPRDRPPREGCAAGIQAQRHGCRRAHRTGRQNDSSSELQPARPRCSQASECCQSRRPCRTA